MSAEIELPQVVNLSQSRVDHVNAELVRSNLTAIQKLQAEEVELQESLTGTATAGKLNSRRSMFGVVVGQQAELHQSMVGGVRAEHVSVEGQTGLIVATQVEAPEIKANAIAGTEIRATNIRTGLLIGRQVYGNVQTIVDTRTVLTVGIISGLVTGLVVLVGRLLFGRRK